MNQTSTKLLFAFTLLSIGLFYGATLRRGHDWGDDFALYVHHAKNIAEKRPYADIGLILNPNNIISPGAALPVFPLILSPVYRIFGLNLEAMKMELIVFFLAALFILLALSRKAGLTAFQCVAICLAVGLHPFLWLSKDHVMSEFPFLLFFYMSFLYSQTEETGWLAALAIVCACGTREMGKVLLVALPLWVAIGRKRPSAWAYAALAGAGGLLILQQIWMPDSTYYANLSWQGSSLGLLLKKYALGWIFLWQFNAESWPQWILLAITSSLAGYGFCQRLKRGATLMEISLIVYCAVLISFRPLEYFRYLMPLIPAFPYYLFYGLSLRTPTRWKNHAAAVALAALLLSYLSMYRKLDFGPVRTGVETPQAIDLFRWVREQTKETDVFVFEKPRALSLYTGRPAGVYHQASYPEMWTYMEGIHAAYLITHARENASFDQFVRQTHRCKSVYRNDDFEVWKVLH